MSNEATVSKWGNSLAVRIPQQVAKQARISEGDSLSLAVQPDGSLVLKSTQRKYSIEELAAKITARNRHEETDWGGPRGKESW